MFFLVSNPQWLNISKINKTKIKKKKKLANRLLFKIKLKSKLKKKNF